MSVSLLNCPVMSRIRRTDVGGFVYHIINRANARVKIFLNDSDYQAFEVILEEAVELFDMRLLSYCIMPNHWHLVLYPKKDGDLAKFMGWLTNKHARRWHLKKDTVGEGHLYQGRYKSFICQNDSHFITLTRYVEQNALKAQLVDKAENWKWSSVWRRVNGNYKQKNLLSDWPVDMPDDYFFSLNQISLKYEDNDVENSMIKNTPFGDEYWTACTVKQFNLGQTLRNVGRPKIKNS